MPARYANRGSRWRLWLERLARHAREHHEAARATNGRASARAEGALVRVGPDETHGAAVDALGALLEPGQVVRGA